MYANDTAMGKREFSLWCGNVLAEKRWERAVEWPSGSVGLYVPSGAESNKLKLLDAHAPKLIRGVQLWNRRCQLGIEK